MYSNLKRLILVLLLVALLMPFAAAQELPEFLNGDVFIDCERAPVGTTIGAYFNDVMIAETTVLEGGTYDIMVQLPDGYFAGEDIELMIEGVSTGITITYEPGLTKTMTLLFGETTNPVLSIIPLKGNIFLGEEGLDITQCLNGATKIAYFAENADPTKDEPTIIYSVDYPDAFFVDPQMFKDKLGQWYAWGGSVLITRENYAFIINDPQIDMQILDQTNGNTLTSGSTVPVGDFLNFKIKTTNLNNVMAERGVFSDCPVTGFINVVVTANETSTQYQTLRGTLHGKENVDIPLTNLGVTTNPWYWPDNDYLTSGWNTAARDDEESRLYANGVYSARAEVNLNNMMKNYPGVGKSVSELQVMTLADDAVGVTVTPTLVTRMNSFYVTVDGRPDTEYIVTLMECPAGTTNLGECGTLTLDGGDCERPPIIRADQDGVKNGDITFDSPDGPFTIGNTDFRPNKNLSPECCEGSPTIRDLVPTDDKPHAKCVIENGVRYYANITTDSDTDPNPGKRTIEFQTDTSMAPDLTWRIHVQSVDSYGGVYTVGDTSVTVNKGLVFMQAAETGPFFLGNDITITGTSSEVPLNTDDGLIYLFMTGPCQNKCGNDLLSLKHADPEQDVIEGPIPDCVSGCESCLEGMEVMTMNVVSVQSDGTWKYVWKTENVPIVPGTYTIYASSKPTSACCLDCDCPAYYQIDITFFEPGIEAEINPSVIERPFNCCPNGCCQDCAVTLSGVASGYPYVYDKLNGGTLSELNLWIFGEDKVGNDKYINSKVPLFSDGTFDKVCLPVDVCTLEPGVYDIILQHPMYNHQFDIVSEDDLVWMDPTYPLPIDQNRKWMVSSYPTEWSKVFPLQGPGYFQGEKARDALLEFLDSGYIDDRYIRLTLTIVDKGQPVAEFVGEPQEGIKPLTVYFEDLSTGDNLVKWEWTFGDGSYSNEQNPTYTYERDGTYTVQLKVTNAEGLYDDVIKADYISVGAPLINANFYAYPLIIGEPEPAEFTGWQPVTGDAPLAVQFVDTSTGNPNMWFWDFGDGETSAGTQNPVHIYDYAGTYTVTLTAMRGSETGIHQEADCIVVTGTGPTPTITPTPTPIYDKISLYSGWNMISVPRTLAEGFDTAASVFGNVPTGDHAIWEYDSFTSKWVQMEENSPVRPLYGIWIYSTSSYSVPLYFQTDDITVPPERNLPAGWSCIGFTGFIPASARDTLLSVFDQWSQNIGWDAEYQVYETPIINGGEPPFSDDRLMYPTKGYWLYMSDPGILSALGV